MGRLLKYLLILVVILIAIVAVYAFLFELPAPERDVVTPVEIEIGQ